MSADGRDPAAFVPIASVDFDGVIHDHRPYTGPEPTGEPIDGAIDAVERLMATYAVVVHTARPTPGVVEWLRAHGIPAVDDPAHAPCAGAGCDRCGHTGKLSLWTVQGLVLVSNRKLPALFYVDDRAIEFTDWRSTLRRIGKRRDTVRP